MVKMEILVPWMLSIGIMLNPRLLRFSAKNDQLILTKIQELSEKTLEDSW